MDGGERSSEVLIYLLVKTRRLLTFTKPRTTVVQSFLEHSRIEFVNEEFPPNSLLIIVLRIEVRIPPSTYGTSLYHYGNVKQNTRIKTLQRIDIKQWRDTLTVQWIGVELPLQPGSCVWYTSASVSTTVSTQVSVMEPNLQLWWLVLHIMILACCWVSISGSQCTISLIQQTNHLVSNQKRKELDGLE